MSNANRFIQHIPLFDHEFDFFLRLYLSRIRYQINPIFLRRFSVSDVRYNGVPSTISVTPDLVVLDGTGTVLSDPADSVYTFLRSEAEKELSPDELGAIPEPS